MDEQIKQELQANFSTVFPKAYLEIRDSYLLDMNGKYDQLREEICKCITFGLFQASITLTNHLLEVMLKDALMFNYCGVTQVSGINMLNMFKESIEKFDRLDLSETINRSCTAGLITKKEKAQLHIYREEFRNGYGHAEKKKIFGEDPINIAYGTIDGSKPTELGTISASAFFLMHGHMQKEKAASDAIPYFIYVDDILVRQEKNRHPEINVRPELYNRRFNIK